jgi:hypothetical protein
MYCLRGRNVDNISNKIDSGSELKLVVCGAFWRMYYFVRVAVSFRRLLYDLKSRFWTKSTFQKIPGIEISMKWVHASPDPDLKILICMKKNLIHFKN